MDIDELIKRARQTDALYQEVYRHEEALRLAGFQRDLALDHIIRSAELPAYAAKRLDDLIYAGSVSGVAKHFSDLKDQAAAINKLDISGVVAARDAARLALDSLNTNRTLLTAQCEVNFEDLFKKKSVIEQLVCARTVSSAFLPTKTELFSVAASITSPWIDLINPLRSIEGVAGLAILGKAINVSPFGETANGTISALIGDWGNHVSRLDRLRRRQPFHRFLYVDVYQQRRRLEGGGDTYESALNSQKPKSNTSFHCLLPAPSVRGILQEMAGDGKRQKTD